jgi:hypothetical protein
MNTSASFSGRKGGIDTRPAESSFCVGSYVGELMKSHYTYRLTALNPVDERIEYIGVRSCECLPEEDARYQGSSRHLPRTIQYRKEIIAIWPTRAAAVAHEVALHDLHDVARSPRFFNKAKQTSVGFDPFGSVRTQEQNRALSVALKATMACPDFRAKRSRKLKLVFANPAVRSNVAKGLSAALSSPEARAKMSAAGKKAYDAPGRREAASVIAKEIWSRPDVKIKLSLSLKNTLSDPEVRKKYSEASKARMSVQKNRDKISVALKATNLLPEVQAKRSAASKALWERPDVRAKLSASRAAQFQNAEIREKHSAGVRRALADPSVRQKYSDAAKRNRANPAVKAKHAATRALKIRYCQEHGIDNPGKGFCNIDKSSYKNWLAQHREAPCQLF